jgi:hypothetical protein
VTAERQAASESLRFRRHVIRSVPVTARDIRTLERAGVSRAVIEVLRRRAEQQRRGEWRDGPNGTSADHKEAPDPSAEAG